MERRSTAFGGSALCICERTVCLGTSKILDRPRKQRCDGQVRRTVEGRCGMAQGRGRNDWSRLLRCQQVVKFQLGNLGNQRERPAEVEDRAIPGHWEGDLLSGSRNSHIVTLVERHSRFTALVEMPSKDTAVVVAALSRQIRKLPTSLQRSLTWDRGLEMANTRPSRWLQT
jgi:hypothetical protein